MRRFAFSFAALLAACAGRADSGVPRYAIVTTIPESDPMHREIESLAALRWAEILHVASFAAEAGDVQDWLEDRAPDFVAAVVRPAEITPAEVRALTDILRRLDDDPFPDAALGWFVATDAAFLRRQIETHKARDALRADMTDLSDHLRSAGDRSSAWIGRALELKKRMDKNFFDYRFASGGLDNSFGALRETRKAFEPLAVNAAVVDELLIIEAQERVKGAAAQLANEVEKARKLPLPR